MIWRSHAFCDAARNRCRSGFTGRQPERAAGGKPRDYEPLKPALVVEVSYDRFAGDRFSKPPPVLRFRVDKKPAQCTLDQVNPPSPPGAGFDLIGL